MYQFRMVKKWRNLKGLGKKFALFDKRKKVEAKSFKTALLAKLLKVSLEHKVS